MHRLNILRIRFVQTRADLEEATGVGGDDDFCPGFQNVLNLALLQTRGHFRFGQIVTAGAAATDVGFGQLDIIRARDRLDEVSGRLGNVLWMGEMTGVMIGDEPLVRNPKSEIRNPN